MNLVHLKYGFTQVIIFNQFQASHAELLKALLFLDNKSQAILEKVIEFGDPPLNHLKVIAINKMEPLPSRPS